MNNDNLTRFVTIKQAQEAYTGYTVILLIRLIPDLLFRRDIKNSQLILFLVHYKIDANRHLHKLNVCFLIRQTIVSPHTGYIS